MIAVFSAGGVDRAGIAFNSGALRDDRAHRGVIAERRAEAAREHPVRGGLVVVVVVRAGADERELVHRLRHFR